MAVLCRDRRRGIVLVLVLWIVVVLGILATSLAFEVRINSRLAGLQRRQLAASSLARGAVAVGMTHLQNDLLIDHQENPNQPYDAYSDVWAQPWLREDERETELGRGTYEVEITDEDSKININTANAKLLRAVVEYYGMEPPESEEVANALVDWRDPDDRVQGAATEYENEFYSAGLGQRISRRTDEVDLVYRCPNEPFLSIETLVDVYGITPELYYGYDPTEREALEQEQRDLGAQGLTVRQRRERRRRGGQLPLSEIVTVSGSGRINVNTASKDVLTIVLYAAGNLANLDGAEAAAESIISHRGDPTGRRKPDADNAIKSLGDLQKVSGLDEGVVLLLGNSTELGVSLDVKSTVYTITGVGKVEGVEETVVAIVDKRLDTYNPDDARLASNTGGASRSSRSGGARRRSRRGENAEDMYVRVPAIRVLQWNE